ncbi:MAG: metal-dependent phosphohydrolase [Pseudomonadota bacterium]
MFNPAAALAAVFGDHLAETYLEAFPDPKSQNADFLKTTAIETLEKIAASDAPYHNSEHTMLVTLVGQQIIKGKKEKCDLRSDDWLHYILALLIHDIGYSRSICDGDTSKDVVINDAGERLCPPRGSTDAFLAPYHVDRGKIYARQQYSGSDLIDAERIAQAIEYTRFPVPDDPSYAHLDDEPGLARAADLIGQIADPNYLGKMSALYREFQETGFALKLGYGTSMDLVEQFPKFFHLQVEPLIGPAVEYLRATPAGNELVKELYDRVAEAGQKDIKCGPFPGKHADRPK